MAKIQRFSSAQKAVTSLITVPSGLVCDEVNTTGTTMVDHMPRAIEKGTV